MLSLKEFDRQAYHVQTFWPLLEGETREVKRMVIARLAALWLNAEPKEMRNALLLSLIEGIEMRLTEGDA